MTSDFGEMGLSRLHLPQCSTVTSKGGKASLTLTGFELRTKEILLSIFRDAVTIFLAHLLIGIFCINKGYIKMQKTGRKLAESLERRAKGLAAFRPYLSSEIKCLSSFRKHTIIHVKGIIDFIS